MNREKTRYSLPDAEREDGLTAAVEHGQSVNASGYRDQLKRHYSIWGLAGVALTVDNAWVRSENSTLWKYPAHIVDAGSAGVVHICLDPYVMFVSPFQAVLG